MSSAQELKINAYLSPNPLDEDSFIEEEWISWLPGYIKGETEDGMPSYYHDSNIALFENIESFTAELFKKATERIWHLLNEHHFKNCIDLGNPHFHHHGCINGNQNVYFICFKNRFREIRNGRCIGIFVCPVAVVFDSIPMEGNKTKRC